MLCSSPRRRLALRRRARRVGCGRRAESGRPASWRSAPGVGCRRWKGGAGQGPEQGGASPQKRQAFATTFAMTGSPGPVRLSVAP